MQYEVEGKALNVSHIAPTSEELKTASLKLEEDDYITEIYCMIQLNLIGTFGNSLKYFQMKTQKEQKYTIGSAKDSNIEAYNSIL